MAIQHLHTYRRMKWAIHNNIYIWILHLHIQSVCTQMMCYAALYSEYVLNIEECPCFLRFSLWLEEHAVFLSLCLCVCKCCLSDKGWDEGEGLRDWVSDDPKMVGIKLPWVSICVSVCDLRNWWLWERSKVICHWDKRIAGIFFFSCLDVSLTRSLLVILVDCLSAFMPIWLEWEGMGAKVCMAAGSVSECVCVCVCVCVLLATVNKSVHISIELKI